MNCFRKRPRILLIALAAYTFGGVRDLIQNRAWQLGLGADFTIYSKPAILDSAVWKLSGIVSDFFADASG